MPGDRATEQRGRFLTGALATLRAALRTSLGLSLPLSELAVPAIRV